MAKVAFLGLGVMGYPDGRPSQDQGRPRRHRLQPHRRQGRAMGEGARRHGRARPRGEAAEGQDFVMMCVGNDNDLREVTLGADGAFAGMKKGAVFVDHTTASADVARELYAAAKASAASTSSTRRCRAGRRARENGELTVMCGGDAEPFARAEPVIAAYARTCRLIGPAGRRPAHQDGQPDLHRRPGAGARPKASHFAKKAGLDVEAVIETISKGAAQSWQMENRCKTMAERQVRLRLRGRLDAQGPRHLPRRGARATAPACRSPRWSTSSMPRCRRWAAAAGTPRA